MAKKKKANNKTLEITTPVNLPGELIQSYNATFGNETVTVSVISVDAKYVASKKGLVAPVTGAAVTASQVRYVCGNKSFIAHAGDVVVLVGKKADALLTGFSKKELDIIAQYEAAKAYWSFIGPMTGAVRSNLEVEEKAIAYLASTCSNEGYWRSTVFNALKKHDTKIRTLEKKFYKKVVKGETNNNSMAEAVEQVGEDLAAHLNQPSSKKVG